jgi:hypothetical protein
VAAEEHVVAALINCSWRARESGLKWRASLAHLDAARLKPRYECQRALARAMPALARVRPGAVSRDSGAVSLEPGAASHAAFCRLKI